MFKMSRNDILKRVARGTRMDFQADLYRPANAPGTANDPQIGPQMIPGPEMIPPNDTAKKLKWRGLHEKSMDYIYLIILSEERSSVSGIKATIKNSLHTAQNTKLTCDCINLSFRKRTAKINITLRSCFCCLINHLEFFHCALLAS